MSTTGRGSIVVGIDGSPESDAALAWACEEAQLRGSAIVAYHVIPVAWELPRVPIDEDEERQGQLVLDEALARVPNEGVVVEQRLLEGSPGELLVEASEGAALVVVGTRRHHGLGSFVVGSVAKTLVHQAHCPVVVVRPRATSD